MPEQTPSPGRIVHYRLSRAAVEQVRRRRKDAHTHMAEHRENANGVQVHVGNEPCPGDIVPLLIVRVWDNEYDPASAVAMDHDPGEEPIWTFPKSGYGVNGQAFLDGNDVLWITSAPQGDGNGFWDWPERG